MKAQRMFAAMIKIKGQPYFCEVSMSAGDARISFGKHYPKMDWREAWKTYGLKQGWRIVPVTVTIEEPHT